jgi:SAM-dependent methyltransferase
MERIPEPELMEDKEQAAAYAQADFNEPNTLFLEKFNEKVGEISGQVLDLGCGPAQLSLRFAQAHPNCVVFAVDGSRAMLLEAQKLMQRSPQVKGRIVLIHDKISGASLPQHLFRSIISNSLLHHLHDPMQLWNALKNYAASNAWIFIMDLFRPRSPEEARAIVEKYSGNEPAVLKRDFFNSLQAAFEEEEIRRQLKEAGLDHLYTQIVSELHVIIYGRM